MYEKIVSEKATTLSKGRWVNGVSSISHAVEMEYFHYYITQVVEWFSHRQIPINYTTVAIVSCCWTSTGEFNQPLS